MAEQRRDFQAVGEALLSLLAVTLLAVTVHVQALTAAVGLKEAAP